MHAKPKKYFDMATKETVNAGIPYFVAGPKFGYEGIHIPIKKSVSYFTCINEDTGLFKTGEKSETLWVTCTKSRYQGEDRYKRCSLLDDGVIHQTYNDRLAFLTKESAIRYANTGQTKPFNKKDLR